MRKITFQITDDLCKRLGIVDGADEAAIAAAIVNTAKANQQLTTDLEAEKKTSSRLQKELNDIKDKDSAVENKKLLTAALDAGKITNQVMEKLEKQYVGKTDDLKELLESMGAYVSVTDIIEKAKEKTAEKYEGKSWDELMESGKMEAFKKECPTAYRKLYDETFK